MDISRLFNSHSNVPKESSWDEATRFFGWCKFNLVRESEKLDAGDQMAFRRGNLPKKLLNAVCAVWRRELTTSLPLDQECEIAKEVLSPADFEAYMKRPLNRPHRLPLGIRTSLNKRRQRRAKRICDTFFANNGEARLANYLRVWQSQERALRKLTNQALGYKCKPGRGVRIGPTEIDAAQMFLSEVRTSGSVLKVKGLLSFIGGLWETANTEANRIDGELKKKGFSVSNKPEIQLNGYFIELGRALEDASQRRELPEWTGGVDQTVLWIVYSWCEDISVEGESWPPLCLLTTSALAKFLTLCNPQRWNATRDPRTMERAIQRVGLVRISRGKITKVIKKSDKIWFD